MVKITFTSKLQSGEVTMPEDKAFDFLKSIEKHHSDRIRTYTNYDDKLIVKTQKL